VRCRSNLNLVRLNDVRGADALKDCAPGGCLVDVADASRPALVSEVRSRLDRVAGFVVSGTTSAEQTKKTFPPGRSC